MNDKINTASTAPHIAWVFPGSLEETLSAATWLNTTNELRKMGWRVSLLASGKSGINLIDGVEVLCLASPNIYILKNVIFHFKFVLFVLSKWADLDVVLLTQPSVPWILPLILLRKLRGEHLPLFVMDTRTVPMEDRRKASFRDRLRALLYDSMNVVGNGLIDGQMAITQRMADKVKIPPDKLWGIWPSGADVELFTPAQDKRIWPKESEPVVITYIGVLHYERNLMALCQAVEMANAQGMSFNLHLTGEGTEMKDLQNFAAHTQGRIQVNPPVPHEKVPSILAQVHVGVLPFPDEEKYRVSSPVKLFEYMAAGLPILATRIVCHTDVVKNGSYVFWAEDSSAQGLLAALRLAWQDRPNFSKMGMEASIAARSWTWHESARKLSDGLISRLPADIKNRTGQSISVNLMDK